MKPAGQTDRQYAFLEPAENPNELGRLAHYRILRELGRGGMGYVFQAEDAKLRRSVALKVMNQKIAATAGARQRFLSEARAMAAVHHDNVATIFEVGQKGDTPFMAMEMLRGQTLDRLNADGKKNDQRLDFETIIRYGRQIADGLAAAHARDIVHRDIKPANIWIESGIDRIKILDFGLALAQSPVDELAGRGSVIGTPGYLSPEQARTEPLDDRSDLYSLGAVLFELATGRMPIAAKTIHDQLIAILVQTPQPANSLNPAIPEPLSNLIAKLLQKEPRNRFASAAELAKQFDVVEEQCHRTSEVAQTIDSLKAGLENVLDMKQRPPQPTIPAPAIAMPVDAMSTVNPFDTLPAGGPPMPAGSALSNPSLSNPALSNSGSFSSTAGGGSGIRPAITTPHAASTYRPASSTRRSNETETANRSSYFLPLAILAAVAVVALPLMTFAFGLVGGNSNATYVIKGEPDAGGPPSTNVDPANSNTAVSNNADAQQSTPRPNRKGNANNRNSNPNGDRSETKSPQKSTQKSPQKSPGDSSSKNQLKRDTNSTARSSPQPGPNKFNTDGKSNSTSDAASATIPVMTGNNTAGNNTAGRNTAGNNNETSNASPYGNANVPGGFVASGAATPDMSPDRSAMDPPAGDALPPLRRAAISTADGGADATVKRGDSKTRGTALAVAIQSRGGRSIQHTYLRFNLTSISDRDSIDQAHLELTPVAKTPVGATIDIFAASEGLPWPEDNLIWNRSFSRVELEPLDRLGSYTVTTNDDPIVRITTPMLTTFLKNFKDDHLTLVLSGGHGDKPVLFQSRERSAETAPKLSIGQR